MQSSDGPVTTSRVRVYVAVLVAVLAAIYVATMSHELREMNGDAEANSFYAWNLAQNRTPFTDGVDLPHIDGVQYFGARADGRGIVRRTPGQAVLAAPFYLGSDSQDFSGNFGPASVAAALFTAAAMGLLLLSLLSRLPWPAAVGGLLVLALTTPVWSVSADQLWTHCITILGIAGAAYGASRNRWWVAGLFLAIGITARPHVAVIALILGVGATWLVRSWRPVMQVGLLSGAGMAALVAWNRYVYGEWSIGGSYGQSVTAMATGTSYGSPDGSVLKNAAGYLFAADRGVVVWTPLLVWLIPAVWRARRDVPGWTWMLALGGLGYAGVQLMLNGFSGGTTMNGYRLALEPLVAVAPLVILSAVHTHSRVIREGSYVLVAYQATLILPSAVIGGYWVLPDDLWTENSVLNMVLAEPVAAGLLLGVVFVMVWLLSRLYARWAATLVERPVAEAAGSQSSPSENAASRS